METDLQNMDTFGSWVEVGMVSAALLAGIITVLLPILLKRKPKLMVGDDSSGYPMNYNVGIHSRLHETLTELRVRTDAARTQIVQFHNSGTFLDGISMKKMSLTHESLENGVSSEMSIKKDLLLSLCVDGLKLLMKNEPKVYITQQLEESWCKHMLQNSNVIAFAFLPLRKNKDIVGYVMAQWCSWNKTDSIDEDTVSQELEDSRVLMEVQLQQQEIKD